MASRRSRVLRTASYYDGLSRNPRGREQQIDLEESMNWEEVPLGVELSDISQWSGDASQGSEAHVQNQKIVPPPIISNNQVMVPSSNINQQMLPPPVVNRQMVPPPAIDHQNEMKRFQSFSIASLAGVTSVSLFALSTGSKLSDGVRIVIIVWFIGMLLLSVNTIATVFSNDNGGSEEEGASAPAAVEGSLGCKPGATISCTSFSLMVLVMYIVDLLVLAAYSYTHGGGTVLAILITVAIALDIIIFLVWVNVWKRPKNIYSWYVMAFVRRATWCMVSKVFTILGCASAEVGQPAEERDPPPSAGAESV